MIKILSVSQKDPWSAKTVLFEVPVKNNGSLMMQVASAAKKQANKNLFVFIADTTKFLATWKDTPDEEQIERLSRGNKQDWMNDSNYYHAERGFSNSHNSPVPLAMIKYAEYSKIFHKTRISLVRLSK